MIYRHLRNARGFFSDYYLGSVFARGKGRGSKKHISDKLTDTAYKRFQKIFHRSEGRCPDAPSCRERFIRPLLREVFGYHLGGGDQRIHGLFTSAQSEAEGRQPLALAFCGAWGEDISAGRSAAAPVKRMEAALAAQEVAYGLLVTGERIRLIRTPGEGPRGAFIEADLAGLTEEDDPESFAAVYRLLHVSQFVPDEAGNIPLRQVEKESREHAEKVSEDLKRAVFTAAESLTHGLLADAARREVIENILRLSESQLKAYRDAALTALYRILFILYAEARDTRLEEHQIYHCSYSIHGLIEDLVRDPARPWPENRSGIWARLNALFAIYDQGLPPIDPWEHIPPRGGDFFNAETAEGRILKAARLPDKIIVRMLLDLATTAPRQGVGRERVSFRELDIESLGAVYEGLLEYEPRVAAEETFEVRVQSRNYALVTEEVRRLCAEKNLTLKGDIELVVDTPLAALHPDAPGEESDEADDGDTEEETLEAEDANEESDTEEEKGLKKGGTARLVRRLPPGHFYFVPGAARKGSGSFYTPLPLVQDIVRHAVGPLVEGRDVATIESLRVIDPACGSAHFLVEAMRFMGRELHRAYVKEYSGKQPPAFTRGRWDDHWQATDEEARAANSEARAWCKRRVAERCLFGIDLNPTAVNLARVALWIESLAGDRPLTYFEHHVRCGNSLLGTWLDRMDLPPLPEMEKGRRTKPKKPKKAMQPAQMDLFQSADEVPIYREDDLFIAPVRQLIQQAAETRRLIDHAGDIRYLDADSLGEQAFKHHQHQKADDLLAAAKLLFDLRSASAFEPAIWGDWHALSQQVSDPKRLTDYAQSRPWWDAFQQVRDRERFFHWELEFPEVFFDVQRKGFDAVIGNPPWDKVLPTKHEFYSRYDILIRAYQGNDLEKRITELHSAMPDLAGEFKAYRERMRIIAGFLRNSGDFPLSKARSQAAHEDVAKYFVDRAARITAKGSNVGMIVPSVLYNGDGCVGFRKYIIEKAAIKRFYAFENRKKIFPIHASYKFVSLVFCNEKATSDGFDAAFMRHDLEELVGDLHKSWIVRIKPQEISRLSPETYAFLEYRSPKDQEIIHKMYKGKPTLGGSEPDNWGATFISWRAHTCIFNSAEDKDLWTEVGKKQLFSPKNLLGEFSGTMNELIASMRGKECWPVYEGKNIEQHMVGQKMVRWWLSIRQVEAKYGHRPSFKGNIVFRDIASNTNERTCISVVLPDYSVGSHSLNGLSLECVQPEAAVTVMNSFCFDFGVRLRTAGTHLSFTYMRPMPVPDASTTNAFSAIPTQLSWESGATHITEMKHLWPTLWQANREVAEAYGLSADDFEHILDSFPVFARKRPEFFAYLKARLAEWKAASGGQDAMIRPYPMAEDATELPMAAERLQSYQPGSKNDK
jgi:hypothetical protein